MGCPCEGEKYYELVWGGPAELSSLVAGFGSAAGSAGGSADFNSLKDKNKTDDDDGKVSPATIKKMIKKYGKLGPNSTWKPKHDRKKKRAAVDLKLAEKVEDVALRLRFLSSARCERMTQLSLLTATVHALQSGPRRMLQRSLRRSPKTLKMHIGRTSKRTDTR